MLAKESAAAAFDLPAEVLEVLPLDPFEQLDVARKITSIALSTRVSALESEAADLRHQLTDRDAVIADLQSQLSSFDSSFSDIREELFRADQDKENLLKENALLSETVKKLNRDVAKLESFRKTLMMSLRDEEGSSAIEPPVVVKNVPNNESLPSPTISGEDEEIPPPSTTSSLRSESSNMGDSNQDEHVTDVSRPRVSSSLLLASQMSTPRLTPPGSPPSLSASATPKSLSKPVSPRRHSISFANSRPMFDDKSSSFSSVNSSPYGSMTGRTRVDGKEFFRQVRSRLSYEQFGAFLANVKELNSQKQSKEDTLRKADEILGPDNKDLYTIFEGLITRNVH